MELLAEVKCGLGAACYMNSEWERAYELLNGYCEIESELAAKPALGGAVARQLAAHAAQRLGEWDNCKKHLSEQLALIEAHGATKVGEYS